MMPTVDNLPTNSVHFTSTGYTLLQKIPFSKDTFFEEHNFKKYTFKGHKSLELLHTGASIREGGW